MASAIPGSPDVTPGKLAEDLRTVVEDTESLLKATAGQAGEKIQHLRGRAQETMTAARARLSSLEQEGMRRAKAAATRSDEYVHENPWTVIGITAGAALLIGMLLTRR